MNAATQVAARFDTRTETVHYSWTQYQLTTTVDGETCTSPLAAMTREDAVAYAKKAREVAAKHCEGFGGMKLSMVSREYSEKLTAVADTHEDGDGSPFIRETAVSGERWNTGRHVARNFSWEAVDARKACTPLQDWFASVGC